MTIATTLALIRDILSDEPWSSTIGGAYTAGGATLTISDYTGLVQGERLDFQDDATYETFRITTTPTSSTVAISHSYDGTTNANHSNGARFYKNPRFASNQIVNAITHVVDTRLFPHVWAVTSTTITPSPSTTNLYDLPAAFEWPISVSQAATGSIEDLRSVPYSVLGTVPSGISATNKALRITAWPRQDTDATLFYAAKATTTTMTAAMEPVIALGVASYLLRTESGEKADRFDEDDRPGRQLRTARQLDADFQLERQRLRAQLLRQYGPPPKQFVR